MQHSEEHSNNSYPESINPFPRIDTYFFKSSNIVIPYTPRPS